MKETKTIIKAENVTAVDFGKLSNLNEYVLELTPEVKIPSKVFGGALAVSYRHRTLPTKA